MATLIKKAYTASRQVRGGKRKISKVLIHMDIRNRTEKTGSLSEFFWRDIIMQ